jgi:hypothetical protein
MMVLAVSITQVMSSPWFRGGAGHDRHHQDLPQDVLDRMRVDGRDGGRRRDGRVHASPSPLVG